MTKNKRLEDAVAIVTDSLFEVLIQLEPETILHIDELIEKKRINKLLETNGLYIFTQPTYPADCPIYFTSPEGKPTLALTRGKYNAFIGSNGLYRRAAEILEREGAYRHDRSAEINWAIKAKDTLLVDLTKLVLHPSDPHDALRHQVRLDIPLNGYHSLNAEERKLAERVFGISTTLNRNLKLFRKQAALIESETFQRRTGEYRASGVINFDRVMIDIMNPAYVLEATQTAPIVMGALVLVNNEGLQFNANISKCYEIVAYGVEKRKE